MKNPHVSNPWDRNLGKLIMPRVFVDVDIVKALIKYYNLANHAFHNQDKSVLCALDR